MRTLTTLAVAALALSIAGSSASAQTAKAKTAIKTSVHKTKKTETEADLLKEAKITKEAATATALARVPGATVSSAELEREHGTLIWSFDLATAGKTGIDEVAVSALTGKVVGKVQHETPKMENKEAVKEAKEKKIKH